MNTRPYDFSLLPPHIISDILKYLNNSQHLLDASRTCKSWYFESLQPKLNKNIRVKINSGAVPDDFDRPFGRLLVQNTDFNTFNYHGFMKEFGHNVHEIELEYCKLSLDQLFMFLVYLPNLSASKIKLNDNNHILNDVSTIEANKSILVVKSILKQIKSIDLLLSCPDHGGLKYIMSLMPNLNVISIGNHKASGNYIFNILFDYLNQFDKVNLDHLIISDLEGEPAQQFFSDFAAIIPNMNIDTVSLGMISKSSYMTYHEENFTDFCRKLSGLNAFSMRGPRECHFNDICRYMTNLKELSLTFAAIKHFGSIEHLKNLQKLHLTSTVCYRGSNYDEDEFMNMFTKLEHLKELSTNLYPITDRVLNAICKNCINLTRLEMLRIMTCNFVPIFRNLVKLKILRLQLSARVEYKPFEIDQNITNLKLLEELVVNAFVPGLTLELAFELPNLNASSLHMLTTNVFNKYGMS